jgi:hypothetical protein
LWDSDSPISCVSARNGLAAKQTGHRRELELSGMAALEDRLVHRLAAEKARWLEDAVRTKTTDTLAQAAAEVALRVRALNMPLEELTSKSQSFQDALRSIEEQRRITRDLLRGAWWMTLLRGDETDHLRLSRRWIVCSARARRCRQSAKSWRATGATIRRDRYSFAMQHDPCSKTARPVEPRAVHGYSPSQQRGWSAPGNRRKADDSYRSDGNCRDKNVASGVSAWRVHHRKRRDLRQGARRPPRAIEPGPVPFLTRLKSLNLI